MVQPDNGIAFTHEKGQRDGLRNLAFWLMCACFSRLQRASLNRCRCFQRATDRKDQGFSLGQRFVGVMKGKVKLKGCVGGERRILKRGPEWALLADRTILLLET